MPITLEERAKNLKDRLKLIYKKQPLHAENIKAIGITEDELNTFILRKTKGFWNTCSKTKSRSAYLDLMKKEKSVIIYNMFLLL